MTNPVIDNIRRSLGRTAQDPIGPRPAIYASRQPEALDSEAARFLDEVKKLSGVGRKLIAAEIESVLKTLTVEQNIRNATVWNTPRLQQLQITKCLSSLGVELVSPNLIVA